MNLYELSKSYNQRYELILDKLSKNSLQYNYVKNELEKIYHIPVDSQMLNMLGLDYNLKENGEIFLNSRNKNIKDEIFCVVDIESTGSASSGQIIEIGAVKIKNSKIIDEFESFIYAPEVPENITELTGITADMLKNAPKSINVLRDFRLFLQDSIFVAHNAQFDYGFIAKESLQYLNAPLLNKKICTLMLARRCINTQKHGLDSLKNILGIDSIHHRALSDAHACAKVLLYCIDKLAGKIKTSEELITFSKSKNKLF